MLLMHLHIFTKLVPAVLVKIDSHSCDNQPGAAVSGNSIRIVECIQPQYGMLAHFDDEAQGHVSLRKGIIYTPHSFLNCANISLCLPHMLVSRCRVKCYTTISQVLAEWLKFTIHQGLRHLKPCTSVDLSHCLHRINQHFLSPAD